MLWAVDVMVEALLGSGVSWIRCGVSDRCQLCLGLTQSQMLWCHCGQLVNLLVSSAISTIKLTIVIRAVDSID